LAIEERLVHRNHSARIPQRSEITIAQFLVDRVSQEPGRLMGQLLQGNGCGISESGLRACPRAVPMRILPGSRPRLEGLLESRPWGTAMAVPDSLSQRRPEMPRELINTGTDKRFVRRDSKGRFKQSVDVGRSLAADRREHARTRVGKGEGDRGDH
jgi:hypothetical protein